jgi:tetratricopeptide (TPR) repeat protein
MAAQLYAKEGSFNRALAELTRLQSKMGQGPGFAKFSNRASLLEGDYRLMWAKQLLSESRREEARRQVQLAQAAYSGHERWDYTLFNLGQLYMVLGERERAKMFFERFLEQKPEGSNADRARKLLTRLQRSKDK